MSYQYDQYLVKHKENVRKGFKWLQENLPELVRNVPNLEWQISFDHDQSKLEPDEYEPYDAYFYGGNRSFKVVQEYRRAWLLHIHRNPHHWQYWVLINDDPKEGEILIEMSINYILEMICDWWSFSWAKGDLWEIFKWYDEHKNYMKLHSNTRNKVEEILDKIKEKLDGGLELAHHGVKGQKWGVRNGPPYPLNRNNKKSVEKVSKRDTIVKDAIESGLVSKKINREKQMRHTKDGHTPGRSYIDGDLEYAQKLVDELSGNGEAILDSKGKWTNKEKVNASDIVGTHVDMDGTETRTNKCTIAYSKTGTHIYPRKEKNDGIKEI